MKRLPGVRSARFWRAAITGFVVTLALQVWSGTPLREKVTGGILAIELAGRPAVAARIRDVLGETGRQAAVLNIALDFPFIAAYVALLAGLCLAVGSTANRFARALGAAMAAAAVAAGVCDAIENIGMLGTLTGGHVDWAPFTRRFAVTKFGLLAVAGGYAAIGLVARAAARLSPSAVDRISAFARALVFIRPTLVFGALMIWLPLTAHEVVAGSSMFGNLFVEYRIRDALAFGLPLFTAAWSIVITALLSLDVERRRASAYAPPALRRERPAEFQIDLRAFVWMAALSAPGVWIVASRARSWPAAVVALLLDGALVTAFVIALTVALNPALLPCRVRRPRIVAAIGEQVNQFVSWVARGIRVVWLPAEYFAEDHRTLLPQHVLGFTLLVVVTGVYLGFYFIFKQQLAGFGPHVLPPATFIFTLLIPCVWLISFFWVPLRRYRIALMTFVLLLVILYWLGGGPLRILGDPAHTFDVVEEPPHRLDPADLIDGFSGDQRANHLIIVAAGGGGILASGWTAKVLVELHRAYPRFGSELRIISAVSGGSVATAYYLAAHEGAGLDESRLNAVLQASMRPSLSPAAFGLAFADLRRSLLPIWVDESFDRGRLLEADWRARGQRLFHAVHIDESSPYDANTLPLTYWTERIRARAAPGVIFNTTVMETGQRVVITPLSTLQTRWTTGSGLGDDWPPRFPSPPTLGEFLGADDRLTVDVWTGARMSATFAYVSPPARAARAYRQDGHIANRCRWDLPGDATACAGVPSPAPVSAEAATHGRQHLIDGAYADNAGVASALNWLSAVLQARPHTQALPFRKIALVEIRARPYAAPGFSSEIASTWLGPGLGLKNAWDLGQTGADDTGVFQMKQRFSGGLEPEFQAFAFVMTKPNGPLSWQMSEPQKQDVCAEWANGNNQRMLRQMLDFLDEPKRPLPETDKTPFTCAGAGR